METKKVCKKRRIYRSNVEFKTKRMRAGAINKILSGRNDMAERIPVQLIQEIIMANDLADLAGSYISLKRSGSSLVGLCPFHKEKTPSLHVSPDRQLFYCFGCGAGGNVVDFVKNIENLDFVETVRFLAQRVGMTVKTEGFSKEDRARYEKKQEVFNVNVAAARFFRDRLLSAEGAGAREYVKKRSLSQSVINTFGIGFADPGWDTLTKHLISEGYKREILVEGGLSVFGEGGRIYDRFRNRLMFPIIDVRGNILGFGGRTLGEDRAKYLNSPDTPVFNKRNNLFALNFAKNSGTGELILVEGYMDVISLYQQGIKNAVAALGTALSEQQARLAAKYAKTVYLCYDTDEAGRKAAMRAAEIFSGIDVGLKVLTLPEGKDPDDFIRINGKKAFEEIMYGANTVVGHRIEELKEKHDIRDTTGKVEYAKEAAKILCDVSSPVERDVYISKIAAETSVSAEAIEAEVKKHTRTKAVREKREEQQMAVRRAVPRGGSDTVLENAERELVSLLIADKSIFNKLKDSLQGLLSIEVHRKMIDILTQNPGVEPAVIVSEFSGDEAAAAAAAATMSARYEDPMRAAKELVAAINKEKHNALIKIAIEKGDLDTLNRLILEKNKSDTERRDISG